MTIDCRSDEGKTIGLIDAIITAAHLLVERDLSGSETQEALRDLAQDKELLSVLRAGDEIDRQFAYRLLSGIEKFGAIYRHFVRPMGMDEADEYRRKLLPLERAGLIDVVWVQGTDSIQFIIKGLAPATCAAVYELVCEDCSLPYAEFTMDTTIPNLQWEAIRPGSEGGGILCANCMIARASKLEGVLAARMVFEFVPGKKKADDGVAKDTVGVE